MTPVSEIIRRRYSCRSYADRPVEDTVLQTLRTAVSAPQEGPFANRPRFVLLAMEALSRAEWIKLGTYGVIHNARLFLAGMIGPAPLAMVDYGYCKESLSVTATGLGLTTCWLRAICLRARSTP